MTLEQRVAALELAIANMAVQQRNADELREMAQDAASELIKNACRTGGAINAAQKQAAEKETKIYVSKFGIVN
ncbi:hypothetical protein FHA44_23270 [Salmonella enterica]|nr:hypothetical protein [Salmonella enterica]EBB2811840.1 hypothetical protein [Salmonella enterica]EBB5446703.1 hypothetical protein [Salmonella enterica]EBB5460595.1 hypothetical protein [Salmonella enterica]EBT2574816.1 hypothetical protein [Salmonella enterica]